MPRGCKIDYTPEFLASLRFRYEQTGQPVRLIARDFGIAERTLFRAAEREGWARPPRDLPVGLRALEQAQVLLVTEDAGAAGKPREAPGTRDRPEDTRSLEGAPPGLAPDDASRPSPPLAEPVTGPREARTRWPGDGGETPGPSAIERVERLLESELTAAEAMRAQLRAWPCAPADAERMARTLATLTQTLHALQRLRGGPAADTQRDDDIPTDINEFRRELARRIDALVASRTAGRGPE
jgi:transposase-like protein